MTRSPTVPACTKLERAARARLDDLVGALRAHLDLASHRAGESDPAVQHAYVAVREAYLAYEDALYDAYDEVTPLAVVEWEDEDDNNEDDQDMNAEDATARNAD